MTDTPNPAAVHHVPWFITTPGETDWLLIGMMVFLIVVILAIGNFYFKLHHLPEHMGHRTNAVQMQIVAVLTLLAMFTHNHAFWIAALLLALVQLPDFSTPIESMAQSLDRLAGRVRPSTLSEPIIELVLAAGPPVIPEPEESTEPAPAGTPDRRSKPRRRAEPVPETGVTDT